MTELSDIAVRNDRTSSNHSRSSKLRWWRALRRPHFPFTHTRLGAAFTVMTHNLGNGLASPEKLVASLRRSTADLVGLQELDGVQADAIDRSLGSLYPYRLLYPDGFAGKGLLSRFPIVSQEQLFLSPDRPDLRAVIDVDGVHLTVIVAHPRPPRVRLNGMIFDPVTQVQIDRLAQIAIESAPAIVVGDFNMTVRHKRYEQLTAHGLIDAFRAVRRGGATLPVRVGRSVKMKDRLAGFPLKPIVRVDYIWHTPHLVPRAAWVGDDAGSDHLPVLATLALIAAPILTTTDTTR
jgi:endonuclease/exonuclease/phosphatase family metal-dependent hydrolase